MEYERTSRREQRDFVRQLASSAGDRPCERQQPSAAVGHNRRQGGLLDVLTPEEVNAVLAQRQLGHVVHYDFAVMALAAIAPLLLWQIYAWTNRMNAGLTSAPISPTG